MQMVNVIAFAALTMRSSRVSSALSEDFVARDWAPSTPAAAPASADIEALMKFVFRAEPAELSAAARSVGSNEHGTIDLQIAP